MRVARDSLSDGSTDSNHGQPSMLQLLRPEDGGLLVCLRKEGFTHGVVARSVQGEELEVGPQLPGPQRLRESTGPAGNTSGILKLRFRIPPRDPRGTASFTSHPLQAGLCRGT